MTSRLFRSVGWSSWITKLTRPNLLPRSPISGQLPNPIELHGMLIYNRYKWQLHLLLRIFPTPLPSKLVRKYRLLTSVSFCTTHADIMEIANIIMNDISCLPLNTQIKIYCFERLKSAIARKFSISFLLLYWNIQMFMSISMYRWAISKHEKWTNSPSKIWLKPAGFTCEMFWRCDVISVIRLQTTTRKHITSTQVNPCLDKAHKNSQFDPSNYGLAWVLNLLHVSNA